MAKWVTWRPLLLLAILAGILVTGPFHPSGAYTSSVRGAGAPVLVSLSNAANNTALARRPGGGNFDGAGDAYPRSMVPSSHRFTHAGVSYLLPHGHGDNVVALGQTIPIPSGRYVLAHVLTASAYGQIPGSVTVHYHDGSSTQAPLNGPDWYRGPDVPVLHSPYRFNRTGRQERTANLFVEQVWMDSNRVATSITLPVSHVPALHVPSFHIFAITLQPAAAGNGVVVLGGRSSTNTLRDGAQIVDATVINAGTEWYTPQNPIQVSVQGAGITTADPASITALGPGEETAVEIGIRTRGVRAGSTRTVTIVARTPQGDVSVERVPIVAGIPRYVPTVDSLGRHTAPDWYTGAKFGIFIHYGLYSVPAWAPVGGVYAEWYWHSMQEKGSATYRHQMRVYGAGSTYDDFIPRFTASRFDPKAWVELFRQAGARYFVLVSKHHDGFALFHTRYTGRNSVDMGPHKDIVHLLFAAARRYAPDIHRGLYYSLPEWYNPAFRGTRRNLAKFPGGPPHQYVTHAAIPYSGYVPVKNYVSDFQVPQMEELIDRYHPDVLWCDIGGPNHSLKVLAHLYNDARSTRHRRQVAVDNRCGVSVRDFVTPEYKSYPLAVSQKWEASRGIDPHSYGYNARTPESAYATAQQLIAQLVDVVSKNGNLLLDIGPRADGTIPEIMQDRLREVGSWLAVNGEAIYDTSYWWRTAQDGDLRFTVRPNKAFYITSLVRPTNEVVVHEPVPIRTGDVVTLLGWNGPALSWHFQGRDLVIDVPPAAQQSGEYAWAFKIAWNGT